MSSNPDATQPSQRRARRSIGVVSRSLENGSDLTVPSMAASRKKSRSKSIGPGGLDALKQSNGNRRQSIAVPPKPLPRSILKPAPLPEIPALKKRPGLTEKGPGRHQSRSPDVTKPTSSESKIAVRTEEEQQAAAREREERERRDARRKSLANRRVSFAAEATLHTFHEIEFFQDSTTSTEATRRQSQRTTDDMDSATPEPEAAPAEEPAQSGRRSSVMSTAEDETAMSLYSDDSAIDEVEEIVEDEEVSSNSSDDGTMMTMDDAEVTGVSTMTAKTVGSDHDNDDNDTLAVALRAAAESVGGNVSRRPVDSDDLDDGEEIIPAFVPWSKRGKDLVDKKAAQSEPAKQAAINDDNNNSDNDNDDDDDDDGMDMEMTMGVGGILPQGDADETVGMGMDMTEAVGRILESPVKSPSKSPDPIELNMDMSMEVTRAIGGIIRRGIDSSPVQGGQDDEQTMEFTKAVGGIRHDQDELVDDDDFPMDLTTAMGGLLSIKESSPVAPPPEPTAMGMDMDMTVGVGRILPPHNPDEDELVQETPATKKLPKPASVPESLDDDDELEMAATLGALKDVSPAESRALSKKIMEAEANAPGSPMGAVLAVSRSSSPLRRRSVSARNTPQPSQSPAPAVSTPKSFFSRGSTPKGAAKTPKRTTLRGARENTPTLQTSETPAIQPPTRRTRSKTPEVPKEAPQSTETTGVPQPAEVSNPTKILPPPESPAQSSPLRVPSPTRPDRLAPTTPSPGKTSRLVRRSPRRSPSPKAVSTPQPVTPSAASRLSIFQTGTRTPSVVLSPQKRSLSGVGVDRPGLGSPKVATIFDRRGSIGESTPEFVPSLNFQSRSVTFQDPRAVEQEEDRERREERDKEDGRTVSQREADDATHSLREMIDSLSPKKNFLRGRKSLHVGSASGILGKRPIELDDDEEDELRDGVKRLKGLQASPVKNVHLPQPEIAINGRLRSHSAEPPVVPVPATPSPVKAPEPATTPSHLGHFRDATTQSVTPLPNLSATPRGPQNSEQEAPPDRISLQDFLNMTSIRFMELNTTKRRPTIAPSDFAQTNDEEERSLAKCVVAGATTVPLLELYQHSCHELKKYISEGRRIVREIEAETLEDNPPLFREYMSAPPEVRSLMDTQFKNVKTHARLLSKAMWYEWRTKLQEGLKEGLVRIADGMAADDKLLTEQEGLVASVLPAVEKEYAALSKRLEELQERQRELAECDPEELQAARAELAESDMQIAERKEEIAQLRARLEAADAGIEQMAAQKQECIDEIALHEKVREECRGWTTTEVWALKARAEALEKQYGWSVVRMDDSAITMRYKSQIEVSIDASSFPSCPGHVTISRIAASNEQSQRPGIDQQILTKQFYIACIQAHVSALQKQNPTPILSQVLETIRTGWELGVGVAAQITRIGLAFPTTLVPVEPPADAPANSPPSMLMRSSLLLAPLQSRVEISLLFTARNVHDSVLVGPPVVNVVPSSRVVYGDNFNAARMTDFLGTKIGKVVGGDKGMDGDWSAALIELKTRLIARGQR